MGCKPRFVIARLFKAKTLNLKTWNIVSRNVFYFCVGKICAYTKIGRSQQRIICSCFSLKSFTQLEDILHLKISSFLGKKLLAHVCIERCLSCRRKNCKRSVILQYVSNLCQIRTKLRVHVAKRIAVGSQNKFTTDVRLVFFCLYTLARCSDLVVVNCLYLFFSLRVKSLDAHPAVSCHKVFASPSFCSWIPTDKRELHRSWCLIEIQSATAKLSCSCFFY